jgi:hypothetical protein
MTAVRKAHPTLRKSFRKTLLVVSGYANRFWSPICSLVPETEGTIADLDEEEKDRQRREAGREEKTVLCGNRVRRFGDRCRVSSRKS